MKTKELEPINVYLTGYEVKGKITIELRKKIVLCPENEEVIKDVVLGALNDKTILSEIKLGLRDKFIAKIFWNKYRPNWFKK